MAATIFTRFLSALGVAHTQEYSDAQFRGMTFRSLYGLSHLLKDYGIENTGIKVADKSELTKIPTPFLAQTNSGIFVIVTAITQDNGTVSYDLHGTATSAPLSGFIDNWNGIALLAYPSERSCEPDYRNHRISELASRYSKYFLLAAAIAVMLYFFITRRIYDSPPAILLTVLDLTGLYLSLLLLQKSLGIRTGASERMCGLLEKGGCDSIMSLKASKLFGVFSWSEVGFGYFGISLTTLLIFPHLWPSLAVCNVCCLPYTVWSIWYQRFRAHHWCTLCVGVQTTLWLSFFCYLWGGWFADFLPVKPDFAVLLATYITGVLLLNQTVRIFKKLPCHEKDS